MKNTNRLLNFSEERTGEILGAVTQDHGARVFAKNRVADVLRIANSGLSNDLYSYALKAHFDFVVTDENTQPLFAVEFDGPHHSFEATAIANDKKKDEICRRLGFSILRINAEFLSKEVRQFNLLRWIVELWFLEKAFEAAQEAGNIPLDEVFSYFLILSTSLKEKISMPYDLTLPTRIHIKKCFEDGLIADPSDSVFVGEDGEENVYSISIIRVDEERVIIGKSQIRSYQFPPMPPVELSHELVTIDVGEKLDSFLNGTYRAATIEEARNEIRKIERFPKRWQFIYSKKVLSWTEPDRWNKGVRVKTSVNN